MKRPADHSGAAFHFSRSEEQRPLLSYRELPFLLILSLLLLSFFLYSQLGPRSGRPKVRICYENRILTEFALEKGREKDYTFAEAPGVTIRLQADGGICFLSSDCPDQSCVHASVLRRVGDFAACLPNRISISIVGVKEDAESPDIIIGEHK